MEGGIVVFILKEKAHVLYVKHVKKYYSLHEKLS